ncbi:MFS transporter [Micromonospora sp. NBC_01699]|uniref:MFS transporter n=1 Tax=Micromonospora sp. NBC_01699 TaxID=2975984 RepID=UPI002E36CAE8|nr:MFS transporter [Micromonospora sp. NBC_01699]
MSRDFGLFWAAQTASAVGDRITGFTVPTMAILLLDASNAEVGLVAAAGWLAYPIVGLFAGALLVRANVLRISVYAELVRCGVFALLATAVVAGWITSVGPVVALVAAAGVATVFSDLSGQIMVPALVPPTRLVGANSRQQGSDSASKLVGPALGGVIIGGLGAVAALLVGAVPFLLSALCRARIRLARPPRPDRTSVLARVRDGLRFTRHHPVLAPLVASAAFRAFGIGAVDAVLLLFAYRALGMSSATTGLLLAVGAGAALVGVVCAGPLTRLLGARGALVATCAEGLAWCALPLCLLVSAPVVLLFALRAFSALWMPTWGVVVTSVRQRVTPADRQATVHATARVLTSSAIPLGALTGAMATSLAGGVLGSSAGLAVVIAAGGLCIAGSVLLLPARLPDHNDRRRPYRLDSWEGSCIPKPPGH